MTIKTTKTGLSKVVDTIEKVINKLQKEINEKNYPTIASAKKNGLVNFSYIGSINSSSKIVKGEKFNEFTYIVYLAPSNLSGYNVCSMSTMECVNACLHNSGHNKIDTSGKINKSRIEKTKLFFENRNLFCGLMFGEILKAKKKAQSKGFNFSVRINGTSDIDLRLFNFNGVNVLDQFSDVQFYDYTKVLNRFDKITAQNYDLTASFSGYNMPQCIDILSSNKGRVAMVFEGKTLPSSFMGFKVIDADINDIRYINETGVICGLRFKKVRNKIDTSNNAFIIPANSAFSTY